LPRSQKKELGPRATFAGLLPKICPGDLGALLG
jgi:hypothetical protein